MTATLNLRCNFYAKHKLGIITPVCDCNLVPAISLEDSSMASSIADLESKFNLIFKWSQSPLRPVCFFHQNRRSLYNCTVTNRNYCSRACYLVGFHQVRRQLCSNQICRVNVVNNLNVYGISASRNTVQPLRGDHSSLWDYYRSLKEFGFIYSLDQTHSNWTFLSNDRGLYPQIKDVGRQYKLCVEATDRVTGANMPVCLNTGQSGVKTNEIITEVCLPAGAVTAFQGSIVTIPGSGFSDNEFSMMSWNVLCDLYTTEDAFHHAQPAYLTWEYRRHRVMAQIDSFNPDILCLQEVQSDHFRNVFEPTLKSSGFVGFFKPKKNKGFVKGAYVVDGCAIFYKMAKFRAVNLVSSEYTCILQSRHKDLDISSTHLSHNRLSRDNVLMAITLERVDMSASEGYKHFRALQTVLEPRKDQASGLMFPNRYHGGGPLVTVVNTHILANPELSDAKFWQAACLMQYVSEYQEHVKSQITDNTPLGLIVAGDFNSTPGSAVYTYIMKGKPDFNHPEMVLDIHGLLEKETLSRFSHKFNFRSLNMEAICADRGLNPEQYNNETNYLRPFRNSIGLCEPIWTNCTPSFSGCLDYVFYEPDHLLLCAAMKMPTENIIAVEGERNSNLTSHFPMQNRPSDHLQLFGRFAFKNNYV